MPFGSTVARVHSLAACSHDSLRHRVPPSAVEASTTGIDYELVDRRSVHSFLLFDFLPESSDALAEVAALVEGALDARHMSGAVSGRPAPAAPDGA